MLSALGLLWPFSFPPSAVADPLQPRPTGWAGQNGSTRSHHNSPGPNPDSCCTSGSVGRGSFFALICRIWAGNPMFGSFPLHPQAEQCLADRLIADPSRCQTLLEADFRRQFHKLLGLSNSLGLRCNSARNFSALSSSKTAWVVWGRREPGFRASTPRSSKARITLRTVWSSQPRNSAIAGAVSPRALANTIWQRRTVKLSDERRPAFNCSRSSDVSSRTKIGFLIPGSIPYSRISCLRLH